MKKIAILLWTLSIPMAYGQSQNFEGFGLAIDYSLNSITDKSTPGDTATSNSGIPSITVDVYKAINNQWLVGAYGTYDLATTDTAGSDPDAQHPIDAGGKLAYAVTDDLLGYIKLGWSWSKFSSPGYYQWMNGPSYGIGAEYLLTKKIFTRVEVSQQNYKSVQWNDGSSDKVNINSYTFSVGYRF
ncbi:outer membrane protein [Polynucleobacter sp. UK-Kesae-W10]|uniref:outer membrane protein n=1 Tax=Polynucleobacter sp. UK-Kesae-W10 TaxID=1819738 RepID=UPI001C0C0CAB|nr:outer membrane beta-barrel protein [Polynucleobacter sp. UK-Kesae-W10]MBU3577310.1 porin family protein [Polynucleobacter sp. UK-Kesae-W10]